jgi:hypothetical protein
LIDYPDSGHYKKDQRDFCSSSHKRYTARILILRLVAHSFRLSILEVDAPVGNLSPPINYTAGMREAQEMLLLASSVMENLVAPSRRLTSKLKLVSTMTSISLSGNALNRT